MSDDTAVSGPAEPGLGSGSRDDAGAGSKSSALDKAIAAAMGGPDVSGEGDLPPQMVQARMKAEADKPKSTKTSPETKADSEDASKPKPDQAEAPDGIAATLPKDGNAQPIEAPNHWPAERKQAFAGLTPDAQKAVLALSKDLEGGYTRKSQELSDQAKFSERVRGLFDDTAKAQLTRAGVDEVGAIQYLMQLERYSRANPAEYVRWAMQSLGVRPEHLGLSAATRHPEQTQQQSQQVRPGTGDAQLDQLLTDPEVAKLRSEFGQFSQQSQQAIGYLYQQLEAERQAKADYTRQQQAQAVQSLQKQWTDFRAAQDDHGQLKYPHADTLMKRMGALMQEDPDIASMSDGQGKLDAAYQAALWASPNLRTSLVEQERSRATAEAQKKADAEKAKRAAAVKPATGAPTVPVKKGGLDSALDAAFAKLGA